METLVLIKAMFKRYAIELRRYSFNTLSMLVSFYFIFLLLFLGLRSFQGGSQQFGRASPSDTNSTTESRPQYSQNSQDPSVTPPDLNSETLSQNSQNPQYSRDGDTDLDEEITL